MAGRLAHSAAPLEATSELAGPTALHPVIGGGRPAAREHRIPPNKTPRTRGPPPVVPEPTPAQIRNILVDKLATDRNSEAIAFYVDLLERKRGNWSAETAEGYAWLFVKYRQAALARRAADAMHDHGYLISTSFASKLLRMHLNDLVYEPEALAKVLEWLSAGLVREKEGGVPVDERMLETVLDALKRMGRSDWLEQVFKAYRDTLDPGEVGSARLWRLVIGAKLLDGDVRTAEQYFDTWRAGHMAQRSADRVEPPPSAPYLVLLSHYALQVRSGPPSRDPAYRFIALCHHDKIEVSSQYLDLLLRVELARKQLSSFWGLWRAYRALGLERSRSAWLLAIRARGTSRPSARQRFVLGPTPLYRVVPFQYMSAAGPPARSLFRLFLKIRLEQTGRRPSLRLPNTRPDAMLGPDVLNAFLIDFIAHQDWPAAALVLETFRVHRVEPDFQTHGNVVLGVVKQWRRGKVQGQLDGPGAGGDQPPHLMGEIHAFEDPQVRQAEAARGLVSARSEQEGLEMIQSILERREMRLRYWTRPTGEANEDTRAQSTPDNAADAVDDVGGPTLTPSWMAQRERRDLDYLAELLRRCQGVDEPTWARTMATTREEVLPARKRRQSTPESRGSAHPQQVATRGKRHRAAMRK
ncbi:hypothetical protein BMF94_6393 [Rhodotorula taiwanensis]|uniref:Uncharacterized protein n=1 Tax=Rhodotorula taiwanensis TaxID=741276 RepID=A0A2S5B1I7_9BASI|nr:hypothetical protein BMF94_6393 [Rhodotorula taiwanensis]